MHLYSSTDAKHAAEQPMYIFLKNAVFLCHSLHTDEQDKRSQEDDTSNTSKQKKQKKTL